jgi:hypothetical protein
LNEIGDDLLGTSILKRKTLAIGFNDRSISPLSAVSLATLGPIVATFVPVRSNRSLEELASALNLVTLPHRVERGRMDLMSNLHPVCGIPGNISVARLEKIPQSDYLGLPPPQVKQAWGRLTVASLGQDISELQIEKDEEAWRCSFDHAIRFVTLKKQNHKDERGSFTVDISCQTYISQLSDTLSSHTGMEYSRRSSLEGDDREEMMETLIQSAQALETALSE